MVNWLSLPLTPHRKNREHIVIFLLNILSYIRTNYFAKSYFVWNISSLNMLPKQIINLLIRLVHYSIGCIHLKALLLLHCRLNTYFHAWNLLNTSFHLAYRFKYASRKPLSKHDLDCWRFFSIVISTDSPR